MYCVCACGTKKSVRISELKTHKSTACVSCSGKRRMAAEVQIPEIRERLLHQLKINPRKARPAELDAIAGILIGAKQRCCNKKNQNYINYGGRGIEFRFESAEAGAIWVLENLGARPSPQHSLDRIDNNGHYEAGNLRWATALEQSRNRRRYKNSGGQTSRIKRLQALRGGDYSSEGLRKYVKLGWTDEQILALPKPPGGRKSKC